MGLNFTDEHRFLIGNEKGSGGVSCYVAGQTWLQTHSGRLKSISFYLGEPAMNYPQNKALLIIKNYDTNKVIAKYKVSYKEESYTTFPVNVFVKGGVNYSFEILRFDNDIFTVAMGTEYEEGVALINRDPFDDTDFAFVIGFIPHNDIRNADNVKTNTITDSNKRTKNNIISTALGFIAGIILIKIIRKLK